MAGLSMAGLATAEHKCNAEGFLDILRCPVSRAPLRLEGGALVTSDRTHRYAIGTAGIPLFAGATLSAQAQAQRAHYDRIAGAYAANLGYPHTQEYMAYLDRVFLDAAGAGGLGTVVELCCGYGEALQLLGRRIARYVGVDLSERMLEGAVRLSDHRTALFVQGDATAVPLADGSIDTVVMLGGIHHVGARAALFREIARILKPGGRLLYREPVSDFLLWRGVRAIVYRLSPMLDHAAERPLVHNEIVPVLDAAGLRTVQYRRHGFLGFCVFMNSDVLVFNRLFRFLPGIRAMVRLSTRFDEAMLAVPGLRRAGLQVVGVAQKPVAAGAQ
jgi:SAM-dependent methyltransferase